MLLKLYNTDQKKKFIDLARQLTSDANVPLEDVWYNTRIVEGLILSKLKEDNIVIPDANKDTEKDEGHYSGAYVIEPIPGLYRWNVSFDLTSLYPSIMRSLNMSPDTIIDDVNNNPIMGGIDCFTASNGSMYRKDKKGFLPKILDYLFSKRLEYKSKMKECADNNDDIGIAHYWMRQYTMKILLNSIYGYFGAKTSRMYDKRIAEGVTTTGVTVIKNSANFVENMKLDANISAGDTDSIFIDLSKVVTKDNEKNSCLHIADDLLIKINDNLTDLFINKFNGTENDIHYFEFKMEKLCKTILILKKKKYAYHLIWDEGYDVDKIGVTGIEVVRSDTPQVCKDFMKTVLEYILRDTDKEKIDKFILQFKDTYKKMSIEKKSIPVGIHGIKKYTGKNGMPIKGSPAHVKAGIFYNKLVLSKCSHAEPIFDDSKIKWYYVKGNPKVDVMGFINYVDELDNYQIDNEKMIKRLIDGKIDLLYSPLNWIAPIDKSKQISNDLFC